MTASESLALDKFLHPTAAPYTFAGVLCQEELTNGQRFLCACRAWKVSLALLGNTRLVVGMQTTPALLCSQERVKEHGHPQMDPPLEDKAVSEDAHTHQKAFLPGMLAVLHIP